MSGLRAILLAVILAVPPVALALGGIVHLRNGIAVDAAYPVPVALATDRAMPMAAYRAAAETLARSNPQDGAAQLALAQARYRGGLQAGAAALAAGGLAASPADAQGWAFYAQALTPRDPAAAALALAQSYLLASSDYFWTTRRAQIAAPLWDRLDRDTRQAALRDVHAIWATPEYQGNLLLLTATPAGARLVTQAYAGDLQQMRVINRWISARRRLLQTQTQR